MASTNRKTASRILDRMTRCVHHIAAWRSRIRKGRIEAQRALEFKQLQVICQKKGAEDAPSIDVERWCQPGISCG